MNKRITIIGGGNMGYAITKALVRAKVFTPSDITIVDTTKKKLQRFKRLQVLVSVDPIAAVGKAHIIVLAVKPQHAEGLFATLRGKVAPTTLAISIMAGIATRAIRKRMRVVRIVRAMPNTPAQIGLGMTTWYATKQCTVANRGNARLIFRAFGEELEVRTDDWIDKATSVAGSGPAYVFFLAEMLAKGAEDFGFHPTEADQLSRQTLVGAAQLLAASSMTPAELREVVTSKGGTTEAVLGHLQKKRVAEFFSQALKKGYKRTKELGK